MSKIINFIKENKKKSLFFLIILILVLFYFFNYSKNNPNQKNERNKLPKSGFSFKNLFGKSEDFEEENTEETQVGEEDTNPDEEINYDGIIYTEKLIKVWDKPVAGFAFSYNSLLLPSLILKNNSLYKFDNPKNSLIQNELFFLDIKTGFIYKKNILDPKSSPIQITADDAKNTIKTYFMSDENGKIKKVFLQTINEKKIIKTISADIPDYIDKPLYLENVESLPDNITYIQTSKDNKILMYLVSKKSGENVYSDIFLVDDLKKSQGKKVFTSPLTEWKFILKDADNVWFYNTPSAFEIGNLFKLKRKEGPVTLYQNYIDHTGSSFLIEDTFAFVSLYTASGLKTFVNKNWNTNSNSSRFSDLQIEETSLKTFSQKCTSNIFPKKILICAVPKKIENYSQGLPDAWYQGFTDFEDDIYFLDVDLNNSTLISNLKNEGENNLYETIDVKDIKINKLSSHLGFLNKNDLSLWTLNLYNTFLNKDGEN